MYVGTEFPKPPRHGLVIDAKHVASFPVRVPLAVQPAITLREIREHLTDLGRSAREPGRLHLARGRALALLVARRRAASPGADPGIVGRPWRSTGRTPWTL